MLGGDDRGAAEEATAEDLAGIERAWWDPGRTLGRAWSAPLGLAESAVAWDVYLVFGPEARWEAGPPSPHAWWHQLYGAPPSHRAGPALADDLLRAADASSAAPSGR
jgi:hypothetical protein